MSPRTEGVKNMLSNYKRLVKKYEEEGNVNLVKYFEARVTEYELKLAAIETFS